MTTADIVRSAKVLFPGEFATSKIISELVLGTCSAADVCHFASDQASRKTRVIAPVREAFDDCGGYKRMYRKSNGKVKLILPPTMNPKIVRMTLREMCLQNYLGHHGIVPELVSVRILKAGTLTQPVFECWQTMQAMDGTLMKWLSRPRKKVEIIDMLVQVLASLSRLSSIGIKHNDAKLDNIMYQESSPGIYKWKLIDLGLATVDSTRGCDVWFFMWWMWHRANDALRTAGVHKTCRFILCVASVRVPAELCSNIHCRRFMVSGKEHIDFCTIQNTGKSRQWFNGDMTKADLYRIAQQMLPPHVNIDELISHIQGLKNM